MKDRLIITISDVSSTKSYNVNKIIKKVFFWIILIVITIVTISFFLISELNQNVESLSSERASLRKQNNLYSQQIKSKIQYIDELGSQLKSIEEIIGINQDDTTSLIQRATLAKLTSAQKTYMLQTIPNGSPLKKTNVTAKFGWRIHPITNKKKFHNGIDLKAARRTDVFATADGVVRYVQDKNKGDFGRMIIISHNFGFETLFAHMRFTNVKVGDVIKKGQLIAKSGNSGLSSGPHLHYEVRYASKVLNPKNFIVWNMKNYEEIFEKQRRVPWEFLVKMISKQHTKLAQQ